MGRTRVAVGRLKGSLAASWRRRTRRRRVRAYCVGTGKSGTNSIHRLLGGLMGAHEPASSELVDLLLAWESGELGADDVDRALLHRDQRLWLELESSHLLGLLAPRLAGLFPDARFILTVRSPIDWVESQIRHELSRPAPHHWRVWRDARFSSSPSDEDRPLLEAGCYPLRGYLRYWERHNSTVLKAVPPERLFVIRTDEIASASEQICTFLGVENSVLRPEGAWSFRSDKAPTPLSLLDRSYIESTVEKECPSARRLGL